MDFKKKYIKYKTKYLELKKQLGGIHMGSKDEFFLNLIGPMYVFQTNIDERLREMSDLTRETEKDVRDTMREVENRIEVDMEKLETSLEDKLQKALDNPLAE